jgi:hypothetical protein
MEESSIAGLYKHFKGDLYIVFGEGIQTETEEKVVVYRSFLDPHGAFFVRPYDSFFSMVEIEDEMHDRFTKLSEEEAIAEVGKLMESIFEGSPSGCDCEDCDCESCNKPE